MEGVAEKDNLEALNASQTKLIKRKFQDFANNSFVIIFIISLISLVIRLYYFPYDVPLTLDASGYFFYSTDMSILKEFPLGYHFPNNGFSTFLSIFFTIFHSESFLDYMALQRLVTISFSVLTIIPVYFLCKKFVSKTYSILGAVLFAFEPHIIQNSLLGLTESMYIFLVITSLLLFLTKKKFTLYISFAVAALSSLVRFEGLVFFLVLTIMFFIHFRGKKNIIKYIVAVGIFVLVITPMIYVRTETIGSEGLVSQVIGGAIAANSISTGESYGLIGFFGEGLLNYFKYIGWVMIPYFIFLVPYGMVSLFIKRTPKNLTILTSIIILSIPALYAYSREIQETRYLLVLIPLFSIISLFTIEKIEMKIKKRKLFLILILMTIFFSSVFFLEIRKYDYQQQRESFILGQQIVKIANGVNDYYPEDTYLVAAQLPEKWPALRSSIQYKISVSPMEGFDSLKNYIKFGKENGLSHLVVDENQKRPDFIKDVFYHPDKYPYLKQVFDSNDLGFKYHVKILQIDYDKFQIET